MADIAFAVSLSIGPPPLAIVADKAYDSRATRQAITGEGALAVIPTRRTTRNPIPYDTTLYAQRKIA